MDGDPAPAPNPSPMVTFEISNAENISVNTNSAEHANNEEMSTTQPEDLSAIGNELTPSKIKRVLPKSPSSPRNNSVLTPSRRDYRELHQELKRKTLEHSKNMDVKFANQQKEYNALSKSYEEKLESNTFVCNKQLKDKIEHLNKEHLNEIETLKIEYEHIIVAKEKLLKEKTLELELLRKGEEDNATAHLKRGENDELFRSKPRRKVKNSAALPLDPLKCQYVDCTKEDNDSLVKCNACDVWVCEGCHDISITKLKQVMNKSNTVFFACTTCSTKRLTFSESRSPPESPGDNTSDGEVLNSNSNPNLIASIKQMFDQHVTSLEIKMESLLDDKLRARDLSTQNADIESGEKEADIASVPAKTTYASILKVPEEVRKALEEAKNDERVEESEQEKRAKNLIIHGAEEYGDNVKEIQEADDDYVDGILDHLGISHHPVKTVRLGKPNERKMRPIKVIMSTKEAKEKVMNNLYKLKGTDEYFGKISVTEDYTQTEREKIRKWNIKAKTKSAQDAEYNYKVRGDPKNGLSLKRYAKE